MTQTIGIVGAGKMGTVVAKLAVQAGHRVYISGSGEPQDIKLIVELLAPGAIPAETEAVVERADIIILLLPLSKYRDLPADKMAGKLVVDAMNFWSETDGSMEDVLPDGWSSSQATQQYFHKSRVVKALNHMGYHDFHDHARPSGHPERKAIAIAGDSESDNQKVAELIDSLGFDPVIVGDLDFGAKLEPGNPVFGASVGRDELKKLLAK